MTISATYSPDTYAGDGSTTTFAITFSFLSTSTNVKVSIKNDTTGVVTLKTAATHYNVSGSNVVFTAGNIPASGETVIIELNPDFKQSSDYTENSNFPAETLEADLDERTLESQITKDLADRSVKLDTDVTGVDTTIVASSTLATNADKYIKFNSDGDGFELQTLSTSSGLGNVADDTTPQLGGNLDVNGNDITSPDGTDLIDITNGAIDVQTNSSSRLDISDSGVRLGGANARVTTVLDEDTMSSDSATSLATQQSIKAYADTKLANIVEDTTPQLGGDLDLNGNNIDFPTTANISDCLDEDDMTSNSATALATQQSIKAYVDANAGVDAASQAEQETGTEAAKYVAPATQQYHASAAKAWGQVTYSTGTPTLNASYNMTSITDTGTGDLLFTIATDFSSGSYAVATQGAIPSASSVLLTRVDSPAAGSVSLFFQTETGTKTDPSDGFVSSISLFGDQ